MKRATHVDLDGVTEQKQKKRGRTDASAPKKPKAMLHPDAKAILRNWCLENIDSPYPNERDKLDICILTYLTLTQVNNWRVPAARIRARQ